MKFVFASFTGNNDLNTSLTFFEIKSKNTFRTIDKCVTNNVRKALQFDTRTLLHT